MNNDVKSTKAGFSGLLMNSAAGGALGGIVSGLLEAGVHTLTHINTGPSIFSYGMVMYGLIGVAFGLGLGILLGVLSIFSKKGFKGTGAFSLASASFFAINLLVIGRFLIFRDVYHEQKLPLWMNLLILVVAVTVFLLWKWLFNKVQGAPSYNAKKTRTAVILLLIVIFIPLAVTGEIYNVKQAEQDGQLQKEAQAEFADKPNVIFIIVDTMRSDFLGCYGYKEKDLSPNIDEVAADGVVYRHAYSQASYTKPSIASLVTSLYVSTHNTVMKPDALPDAVTTIAEAMHDRGYYTVGFADNPHISPQTNFDQGYDEYYFLEPDYFFHADRSSSQLTYYSILRKVKETVSHKKWIRHYYQDASVVNEHVLNWLGKKGTDRKFFLFIHYMDTHDPYFEHPENGVGYARVAMAHPPAELAPEMKKVYQGELVYVDHYIGELMDWLKARNLYDNTSIVITADHGEEFHEHGGWWHGQTLYSEQINVPLIIKYPHGRMKGLKPTYQVQSIDVAPTLLHVVGAEIPPAMQGVNLLGYDENEKVGMEYVYSEENLEGNVLVSVKTPEWKLIEANKNNPRGLKPVELYDMKKDYREKTDLAPKADSLVTTLSTKIKEFQQKASKAGYSKQAREIDEATAEQLKALGYVQ